MPEITDLDPTADGNALPPPNGFPEDMAYSEVNNSARELMSVIARNYRDENGSISATGQNDLVISTNGNYPNYYQGLRIGFRAAQNNTGQMTIALNTLDPVAFLNTAGAPMEANSIIAGLIHFAVYNGTAFQLITNGFTFPGGGPGLFSAASPNITPEGDDRVALLDFSNSSAPSFASITAIRNATELFNLSNPPASPAVGDILHFQDISSANAPSTGTIQQVLDLGFTQAKAATALGDGTFELLGINGATADTTNRISAITPGALLTAVTVADGGDGNVEMKINKESSANSSLVNFQTAGTTRANVGILGTGDEAFRIRVSSDGVSFNDAVRIDPTNGFVGLGDNFVPQASVHARTAASGIQPAEVFAETAALFETGGNTAIQIAAANNANSTIYFSDPQDGNVAFISYGHNIDRMNFRVNTVTSMAIWSNNGVVVGNPTSGSRGAGTLNAQAVFDDGVLLTCYVFDQAIDGSVDPARWDEYAPDREIEEDDGTITVEKRTHEPVRKFLARIGTEHDPLDIDAYAAHWRDKRHLTSMPNKVKFDPLRGISSGEWIQRLIETVEIQAVLIEQLNQRLKAVESN